VQFRLDEATSRMRIENVFLGGRQVYSA